MRWARTRSDEWRRGYGVTRSSAADFTALKTTAFSSLFRDETRRGKPFLPPRTLTLSSPSYTFTVNPERRGQGRFAAELKREFATRRDLPPDDEGYDADTEDTREGSRLKRAHRRAVARGVPAPVRGRHEGPFGPVTVEPAGRGGKPYVTTRGKDYERAQVGSQYGHPSPKSAKPRPGWALALSQLPPERQKELARALRQALKTGTADTSTLSAPLTQVERRALAYGHGITHFAEEQRVAGTKKHARGLLRLIEKGEGDFSHFYSDAYPIGTKGGTARTRAAVRSRDPIRGVRKAEEAMSTSSSSSSDEEGPSKRRAEQ